MSDEQHSASGEPANRPGGRPTIAQLADELMPVLIAHLETSALGELEVRENGWRIRLRRPVSGNGLPASDEPLLSARPADAGPGEPRPSRERPERGGPDRAERQGRTQLSSPAVGYFTPREGLSVGATLRNGDVVGHIDVLGVRQEVVVPYDAQLARLDVEPGQAVEYGQPIARLEPEARG